MTGHQISNNGTPLADAKHLEDFIDTYTTVLNFLPDNGVTEVLEGIVTVVEQVALKALGGLDGIAAMVPDGSTLRWLNQGPALDIEYFSLSGDYEPIDAGLLRFAQDILMDRIFKAPNDLIVPTSSTWEDNDSDMFPIEARQPIRQVVFLVPEQVVAADR